MRVDLQWSAIDFLDEFGFCCCGFGSGDGGCRSEVRGEVGRMKREG